MALVYFRASRYVVVDNWWWITWVFNGIVACGVTMVLLLWFARSTYLQVKGRLRPGTYRRQMVAASCAYLCVWLSVLGAYRWRWRPWFRSCALRTIEEEPFNPHIAPALSTFVRHLTPEEERELVVWMARHENPAARFNAAYILARRNKPEALRVAADVLARIEATGARRRSANGRYDFPVGLAKATLMQMTGFRALSDTTPPRADEWDAWTRWHDARPSLADHTRGDGYE